MNAASRILTTEGMQHVSVPFAGGSPTALREFIFSGTWPNASASPIRQAGLQGTLYEAYKPTPDSILKSTREFMARQRPQDYIGTGREVEFLVDDTARAFLSVQLHDPWVATDSASWGLGMIPRDTSQLFTNTIGSVQDLFRSNSFTAHDTVVVGCELRGRFRGDTAYAHGHSLHLIAELVNASNHQAVAQLDSFGVSNTDTMYAAKLQDTLDVVSGTYYLRLRIESDSFPAIPYWWQQMYAVPLYPVAEIASYVGDPLGIAKLRREGATTTAQARIDAQPNPFTGTTELRFSIPTPGYATVRVFDPVGRMIAEVLPQQWMELGRYAVEFDASQLQPGTYLVELMLGQQRVVEKMVVVR